MGIDLALAALILVVSVATLTAGPPHIPLDRLWGSLAGAGRPADDFVLLTVRLPRLLTALLVGAALAISGAIFQSLSRNPLGSPDIMGLGAGAATGALVALFAFDAIGLGMVLGSMLGGLGTATLVYALAYRGGIRGYRFVLVGIGIGPVLAAVNSFILSRANVNKAQEAAFWLVGSLNGAGWEDVLPVFAALLALIALTLGLRRQLEIIEMGDDLAFSLGVRVEAIRCLSIAAGVLLAAVATSSAGPIPFVALAAPHIARGLAAGSALRVSTAGLVGALLLSASDLLAQRLPVDVSVPVGVVTGALGGLYLTLWLTAALPRSTR
ncbi:iron chelate uptake ABC transporter family permease subunit [Aureimonas sp. ME7]|uniref:FecCD family ABC transporter permease n=1 Tax=Aureimonas sp. ME7 TaxID=2744252 RepID=UPI001AEF0F6B|nr:iron chelate uptake ABC transporter family permease subunit [Aureimonas sp. ME7]